MLTDFKSLWKAIVINWAITAVWYMCEYEQFGCLQWDRWGDNVVSMLYTAALWYAFHQERIMMNILIEHYKKLAEEDEEEV
jgi:hypothetical protein